MTQQRRQWHPTPVLLPRKSHGWRSLVGCSPWGCEESDTTEHLHFHFSLSCIGEGNGNPFQCSCLENPRDGTQGCRLWGRTESDMTEVTQHSIAQHHDTGHSGFQVLLSLQLIMKFCEASHPNTRVRECGGQLIPKSEVISPWTEVLQTLGADTPLAHVGMFISHMWRESRSQKTV